MAASMKVPLIFLVCIAILALPVMARTVTTLDQFVMKDFASVNCTVFTFEATKCMIDVMKNSMPPHPSCCRAILKLNDCNPEAYKDVPSADKELVKKICALWGV
uniref:Prolamin-like domain-containing protein n=1 Tax=Cucumis melo TaxID=3656 RepID=A0A9I9CYE3_CUCME